MNHTNTIQIHQTPLFSSKPLYAIIDFFALISAAWDEAKEMEQKSHKNSANW